MSHTGQGPGYTQGRDDPAAGAGVPAASDPAIGTTHPEVGTTTPYAETAGEPDVKQTAKQEAGKVADQAKASGKQVAETAKTEAGQVVDEAKAQAQSLLEQGRTEIRGQAESGKERLTANVRAWSDELDAIDRGESTGDGPVGRLLAELNLRGRDAAQWLETHDIDDLFAEVSRFARRRPLAFMLVAGGLGLLAGRFARGLRDDQQDPRAVGRGVSRTPGQGQRSAFEPGRNELGYDDRFGHAPGDTGQSAGQAQPSGTGGSAPASAQAGYERAEEARYAETTGGPYGQGTGPSGQGSEPIGGASEHGRSGETPGGYGQPSQSGAPGQYGQPGQSADPFAPHREGGIHRETDYREDRP